jgi:hypothetical protein
MRVWGISLVALALAISVTSGHAIEPAKHTVDWYRTHQQARDSALAVCQNDHSLDETGDCRNAQSASHAVMADTLAPSSDQDPEANPAYYGHDGSMIALTLTACAHHQAPVSWCKAAQTASTNLHK